MVVPAKIKRKVDDLGIFEAYNHIQDKVANVNAITKEIGDALQIMADLSKLIGQKTVQFDFNGRTYRSRAKWGHSFTEAERKKLIDQMMEAAIEYQQKHIAALHKDGETIAKDIF